MAFTRQEYVGDGTTRDFVFTFPYRHTSQIQVLVGGTGQTEGVNFAFFDANTVRFEVGHEPANGSHVVIRRVLDFSVRPNQWRDTNRLPASDHNREDDEDLWRSQENYDNRGIPRAIDRAGAWDAQDDQTDEEATPLIIGNVNDPVLLYDAVNLRYLESRLSGQQPGLAGVFRLDLETFGDGETVEFELIPQGEGVIPQGRNDMVFVAFDGVLVPYDLYTISPDGRHILFTLPPGNGVRLEAWVQTVGLLTFVDGTILPNKIALAEGRLITGDSDGLGTPIARDAISLSELGAAAADLDLGGFALVNVADPTADQDAATKAYVDAEVDAVAPFPSVTSGVAYTLSQVVQNTSAVTQLVNMQIIVSANINAGKTYALQYADNAAMTTNLKTIAQHRVTGDNSQSTNTIMGLVPSGKYWRLHITGGSHSSLITFAYQLGGV